MKILFLGPAWAGSNAASLANGFAELGHEVCLVDTTPFSRPARLSSDWLLNRLDDGDRCGRYKRFKDRLIKLTKCWVPDIQICFKTIQFPQEDLLDLPSPVKIFYSPDDLSNTHNTTASYLRYESAWDLIVTTKRHNINEVRRRTAVQAAPQVQFVYSAYDPAWHHRSARTNCNPHQTFELGFIGHFRNDRHALIRDLAVAYGPNFFLAGDGWNRRDPALRLSRATMQGPAYGDDFSRAVADVFCNLVLLNSENRDTHTCRTFEIPAAGGLFVGQRTKEHLELLEEGREALYFSDLDELIHIVERIKVDRKAGNSIAENGWRAITKGGHTYRDRASEIIRFAGN